MSCRAFIVAIAVNVVLFASTAGAKGPEIYPLSEVRPGQKGYGLTTFSGTVPERFEFEVIGVMKNFLPKMDIILVKSDDKKLEVSGFWQGMSGSPLYLDGRVACAFSYGFRFNKVAIGGCTPIHYMKSEGFRKARRAERVTTKGKGSRQRVVHRQSAGTLSEWLESTPGGDVGAAMKRIGTTRGSWLVTGSRLPKAQTLGGQDGLTPAAIPLALSGFSGAAFAQVKKLFGAYPFAPMTGGGTGQPDRGPDKFRMGGSIAIQLIRGDMSAAGTGTVSYIDGKGVLAFGHPMFQAGEIYAPVTTANVLTVIPSAMNAFVIASPLREVGTLMQDRKSTIAADTSLRTRMVPVDITVRSGAKRLGGFSVEVLNDRFFTGTLAGVATFNAVNHFLPDRDRVTARIRSRIELEGFPDITFVDFLHSDSGALSLVSRTRGLRAMAPLLSNPFAPVRIKRLSFDVDASYQDNFGDIADVRLPSRELAPGARHTLELEMTTYDGKRVTERVPFNVPASLAGSIVRLKVSAGDAADLDAAPPETLPQLVTALRKLLPGDTIAVTLHSADEGVAVSGKLVRDLPASAADRLKSNTQTAGNQVFRPLYRTLTRSKRVINGEKSLLVKIAAE